MGRKVVAHSPDKHPEQGDASTAQGLDAILEAADKGQTSGTIGGSRKDMQPAQTPNPLSQPGSGITGIIKGAVRKGLGY